MAYQGGGSGDNLDVRLLEDITELGTIDSQVRTKEAGIDFDPVDDKKKLQEDSGTCNFVYV